MSTLLVFLLLAGCTATPDATRPVSGAYVGGGGGFVHAQP